MQLRDRIPGRGRAVARRAASYATNAAVRARATVRRDTVPGLLSFVVPVYDTEKYLDECLTSLRFQEYRNVEIVCVDDGTPDDSVAIVRRHRLRDPRVRLVRRPNGGLSAARNTGVAAARGEYLAFVDSDDMVPPAGYRTAVESLDRTGSDFAVLPYQRWRAGVTSAPPLWVRNLHTVPRKRVTVDELPDVMANAIICSKVFRREVWDGLGLSFVEGIIYEDQQVSAEAYARAEAIDVLTTPLYLWRHRNDRSSISQGKGEIGNLRAQLAAANESIEVLRQHASDRVVTERLLQLLSNDMPQFTARVVGAEDEFWELLREELPVLLRHLDREVYLERVPPQQKVLQHLVLTGQRAAAEEFVRRGGLALRNARVSREDVGLVVKLPFWRDPTVDVPDECFRVSQRQTQLRTSVRAVSVEGSVLRVRAWAFIENVDLSDRTPEVHARAVAPGRPAVALVVRTGSDDAIDELNATGSGYSDYRRGALDLELDLAQLDAGAWEVQLDMSVAELTRTARLGSAWSGGSGALRHAGTARGGLPVMVACGRTSPLVVSVYDDGVVVDSVRRAAGRIVLAGQGERPGSVQLQPRGGAAVRADVTGSGGRWEARLGPVTGGAFDVLAGPAERSQPVRWSRGQAWHQPEADSLLVPSLTERGELRLTVHSRGAVVEDVTVEQDRLVLTLVTAGVELADHDALFVSGPATSTGSMSVLGDDRVRVELPYRERRWGCEGLVLVSATYELALVHRATGERVVPRVGGELLRRLPVDELVGPIRCQLQLRPAGRALSVVVAPPLPVSARGIRNQLRLQAIANEGRAEDAAVFFRTLYGEAANDNGAALHHVLRRRRPDLTLYWSVQDLSVEVPSGGVPLLEGTPEWFERLGAARFCVVNVHQPMWYRKPAGQVLVQTFHGYPYKGMGQEWWRRSGLPESRISSFLDRAGDWDHLVSPSSYATPKLLEAFFRPEDAAKVDVIEAGYPRNDVLLGEEGAQVRARTRAALGIAADQTAVLYAPTFRDYLSNDGMTAKGTRFFDPQAAADALGPGYVILVRGHAFHARAGQRRVEGERVVDVTYYPDVTDLCLASDAAVLDYSSLRFDYALLRRPMVFLVPDEEEYHQNRPAVLPFRPTAPGPKVTTTAGVVRQLRDLEGLRRKHADAIEKFVARFMELEDGHAAERVVARVFGEGSA